MAKFFDEGLRINEFLKQFKKNEVDCPNLNLYLDSEVSPAMMLSFFKALETNTTTTSLSLDSLLKDDWIPQFITSLEKNTKLTNLSYGQSKFSPDVNKTIQDILNRNRKLALEQELHPVRVGYDRSESKNLAFKAAQDGNFNLLYTILEDSPQLITERHWLYLTLLHTASKYGYVDCIKLLIARGADVNCNPIDLTGDITEGTPLHCAVGENQFVATQLLLKAGASVHLKENGFTPLHDAKTIEMADLLLQHGADINAVVGEDTRADHCKGNSVLHAVVWNECASPKFMSFLISKGANVKAVNKEEETVAHIFAHRGPDADLEESLTILINAGMSMTQTDSRGRTPEDLAKRIGSKSSGLIGLITKKYINANAPTKGDGLQFFKMGQDAKAEYDAGNCNAPK